MPPWIDTAMKCPNCATPYPEVRDSRKRGGGITRRRECYNGHRFTTLEHVVHLTELPPLRQIRNSKHPPEVKAQCLAARQRGDTLPAISAEYGIPEETVRDWIYPRKRAKGERHNGNYRAD